MRFPNAEKGIRKIYFAEIFAICAAVLSGATTLLLDNLTQHIKDAEPFVVSSLKTFSTLFASASLVMMTLTAVFAFIGYVQAGQDEVEFRKAMICAVANGVLVIVGMFFQISNGTLYTTLNAAAPIVEMFVMIFGLTGLINIAERCERTDMVERGSTVLQIVVATYIISSLNALIIRIFELAAPTKIIALVTGLVDLALSIVQYIIYLRYLKASLKLLRALPAEQNEGAL